MDFPSKSILNRLFLPSILMEGRGEDYSKQHNNVVFSVYWRFFAQGILLLLLPSLAQIITFGRHFFSAAALLAIVEFRAIVDLIFTAL